MLIAQNILLVRLHAAFYYTWRHQRKRTEGDQTLHQVTTDANLKDLCYSEKSFASRELMATVRLATGRRAIIKDFNSDFIF
jgi:hypothetical protein